MKGRLPHENTYFQVVPPGGASLALEALLEGFAGEPATNIIKF
jgi:hypothetical protein